MGASRRLRRGAGEWALWDTVDHIWFGRPGAKGPNTYKEKEVARLAADLLNERLEAKGRVVAKRLPREAFRFRDEITPKVSFNEAMDRLKNSDKP